MEEEDGGASTPFWLQSRRNNTYFHRTSSLGNRATSVAIQSFFAGVAAILIVFFIIPPFFSSVSQFLRPHLVRKSWDYLNFVLVLFAVVCGFLSRNTGNNDESNHNKEEEAAKSNDVINGYSFDKYSSSSPSIIERGRSVATPRYWIDDRGGDQFQDQTVYKRFSRLRSVSSYPDLRNREFETDERWRFYDDTRVSECRYEASDPIYQSQEDGVDGGGGKLRSDTEKVEVVETATAERRTKRVYHDVAPKEEKERADFVEETINTIPPPATTVYRKSSKKEKKKGGATKEFLIALRRKKKKQRQQSIDGTLLVQKR
ncbi:hydroxyproline-rich glycoprotein family protein [Raphanus sativus]|nr:hydroxyproline-rich glycoprotein family protein [Raphanus sativus]